MSGSLADRRRDVIVAGHLGDHDTVLAGLDDPAPEVRAAAVGAAARSEVLAIDQLRAALADDATAVRLRAIDIVAAMRGDQPPSLATSLHDPELLVVERAAWATGERTPPEPGIVAVLGLLTSLPNHKLVREAAVAALGALGDREGLTAILAATADIATVRRRAVLALAPFDGDAVTAALEKALTDRDWQTRQAAADVLGVDDVIA